MSVRLLIAFAVLSMRYECRALACPDGDIQPCGMAFKCSYVEDVVWASDGRKCSAYRNGCLLASENCNRRNRCLRALREVEKEECQDLCPMMCTRDYQPICGEYNETLRTFSNKCEMESHICQTGQTYNLLKEEECNRNRTELV